MTSRSTRIGAPTVRSRHAVLASLTVGLMALTACSSGSGTAAPPRRPAAPAVQAGRSP